jgi:hypothetical protein
MPTNRKIIILTLSVLSLVCCRAQQLRNPFDFPIVLSGNFGELRPNHFHSGIDFKTQQQEGKPVHAAQAGYVSRVAVSPWGYGNVIYMTHPDSAITVYAHLQKFEPNLARYVKTKQYEMESFQVDLSLPPGQFAFAHGEVIAYSGNSGSSGGPHLHYEIRDARTGEALDPLPFYKDRIKDARPPKPQAVMICPVEGMGVVGGSTQKRQLRPLTAKDGSITFGAPVEAWGKIGFAINADDYMDGASNVYGVKEITMSVDGNEVFHSHLDRFSLTETRYINAWIDYETWIETKHFYTKTFVEQGNRLPFLTSKKRGYVTIDEQRTYRIDFQLTDAFDNTCRFTVHIAGKEQPIPAPDTADAVPFYWRGDNHFGAKGIRLLVPDGSLFSHFYFRYKATPDSAAPAAVHQLHDRPVALYHPAHLSLRLQHDCLTDKRQYGIVALRNGRLTWIGGIYRDGWIDANISELGNYTVRIDSVAPRITPLNQTGRTATQTIAFRLTDNLSGIDAWRATIDGAYALFSFDGKKSLITYTFDPERLKPGKHTLRLTVADACGNQSIYETEFDWK